MTTKLLGFFVLLFGVATTCSAAAGKQSRTSETSTLEKMAARFVPTDITADLSKLAPNDRRVLTKLVEASKIIDGIFLRQVWSGNVSMLLDLAQDQTPEGRA